MRDGTAEPVLQDHFFQARYNERRQIKYFHEQEIDNHTWFVPDLLYTTVHSDSVL